MQTTQLQGRRAPVLARMLAGLCCMAGGAAQAFTPLDTEALLQACRAYLDAPASPAGALCPGYLQGFIEGSVVTDEQVAHRVADEFESGERWSQRAMRTRLGGVHDRIERTMRQYGPSYYADYCFTEAVAMPEFAAHVLAAAAAGSARPALARDLVYGVLREHYPCRR